jgi:hypothetical protein
MAPIAVKPPARNDLKASWQREQTEDETAVDRRGIAPARAVGTEDFFDNRVHKRFDTR